LNKMDNYKSIVVSYPKAKSTLIIVPNGFEINFPFDMPNIWIRFWQWLLLGWHWMNFKELK